MICEEGMRRTSALWFASVEADCYKFLEGGPVPSSNIKIIYRQVVLEINFGALLTKPRRYKPSVKVSIDRENSYHVTADWSATAGVTSPSLFDPKNTIDCYLGLGNPSVPVP
jgi:hypothetical protein